MWRSDVDVADAVLGHLAAGTTHTGIDVHREPVHRYLDDGRFRHELAAMRLTWAVLCPSASVPVPGSYAALESLGMPVVVSRSADGCVRVLRNVCRHRGMAVADGSRCAKALVCRYHGWTYALDGRLASVPHRAGFPDLCPEERGLVAVGTMESDGLVFVNHAGGSAPSAMGHLWNGLLDGDGKVLTASSTQFEDVNWKVLTETFLEGLHIGFLHRRTFLPLQYDNVNVVEHVGPHSRVTFPYRNIEKLRGRPRSDWDLSRRVTFVHSIFPNAVIATFPDQHLLFVFEPQAVDRTAITTYVFAAPSVGDVPRTSGPTEGDLLLEGGGEDFEAARSVQRGLASGVNDAIEFGLYESAITHFHSHLDAAVNEGEST